MKNCFLNLLLSSPSLFYHVNKHLLPPQWQEAAFWHWVTVEKTKSLDRLSYKAFVNKMVLFFFPYQRTGHNTLPQEQVCSLQLGIKFPESCSSSQPALPSSSQASVGLIHKTVLIICLFILLLYIKD